jgi:Tol biopolymer transport system component
MSNRIAISVAVSVSRINKAVHMRTKPIGMFLVVILAVVATGIAADTENLLVDNYGKLLLIGQDGAQRVLRDSIITASYSPDGLKAAFTYDDNPRAFPNSSQVLSVMTVAGGTSEEITKLPPRSHFESIGWLPDGSAVIYEGKDGHLFIAPLSLKGSAPRDLGRWYQGFSVSPDGSKIVHAVNSPTMGLEVLDVVSGQRTLIHKASKVVWSAKFSPDGQWIAYQITTHDPPRTKDDEPNCTPPTIGLRLYSMRAKTDVAVTIASAPKDWQNVKSYNWSPDSKRLALTLGTVDCDYPGSANGVFVTSIDFNSQTRASVRDMSFEPVFSPDGKAIAFVDFSDTDSRAQLIRYDLQTGARRLIRKATESDNYYRLLDWK